MRVLGIETSCDETAAAVVVDGRRVLSSVIASQDELHAEYGGVVPEVASRAHLERLLPVVRGALERAGLTLADVDVLAVGHRPGLIGSLLVGLSAAKSLAWSLGRRLVGVDHVHAHLYAGLLGRDEPLDAYPALGLVASGGHTSMYACTGPGELRLLGSTIDDAIGEAYDKVATILGLGYPGGPAVDRLACEPGADERAHDFPIARLAPESLDFSFSGLKTSVLYAARGVPDRAGGFSRRADSLSAEHRRDIAASFQRAASAAIELKLTRGLERVPEARTILVGGGVAANSRLRETLESLARRRGVALVLPAREHCVDNAAMIAGLGHHLARAGRYAELSLAAVPTTGDAKEVR